MVSVTVFSEDVDIILRSPVGSRSGRVVNGHDEEGDLYRFDFCRQAPLLVAPQYPEQRGQRERNTTVDLSTAAGCEKISGQSDEQER